MNPRDKEAVEYILECIDAMPGVYWKRVRGMREVLAHDYDAEGRRAMT